MAPSGEGPPKPELPEGAPTLERGVKGEIRRQAGSTRDADDIARALSAGSASIDAGDGAGALPFLLWAKNEVPRSPSVREALGVAHYLDEDYAAALREVQAYRRMTGKPDQNHIIADCHRALGRETDRIASLVEEMAESAPRERYLEGLIVWASSLADAGDVAAGRAVLREQVSGSRRGGSPDESDLRLWYVAGDLAERDDDRDGARELFAAIVGVANGFFDTEERLDRLED